MAKKRNSVLSVFIASLMMIASSSNSLANDPNAENTQHYEARVLVRASSRIEYKNELVAPILKAPFLEGQSFKQGDTLIEFNCDRYLAEQQAAKASANAATIEHNTKRRLHKYKAAGKNEVALAAAHSMEANAKLKVHKVRNQSCKFEAPFNGRVVELNAQTHEFPPSESPLIVIINDEDLEMEMVVPSHWLKWLKLKSELDVRVDETGEVGKGLVERIAAEVDPVSQTVKVIASFKEKPTTVLAGMSGAVRFLKLTH